MRQKGNSNLHNEERNLELMRAYQEILNSSTGPIDPDELFIRLVEMPCRRFWIGETCATDVIRKMRVGWVPSRMTRTRLEMYAEILSRTEAYLERHPGVHLQAAVRQVIAQPAPKFYLTPGTARVIVSKCRKQWYAEKFRRLRHLYM